MFPPFHALDNLGRAELAANVVRRGDGDGNVFTMGPEVAVLGAVASAFTVEAVSTGGVARVMLQGSLSNRLWFDLVEVPLSDDPNGSVVNVSGAQLCAYLRVVVISLDKDARVSAWVGCAISPEQGAQLTYR